MSQKQASLVGTIDSLLETMGAIPSTKSAEAYSEPGSQGGATTHPTKDVDDSLQKATEGSQSATNEADVKKDQPLGVDKAEAGAGGSQDDKQMNIGITSKPTGEDSAAETSSAKAGKDDPGSTHPARTDNDSLDGMKYASPVQRFRAFAKQAETKGNALVAAVAAASDNAVKAANKPAAKSAAASTKAAPAAKAAEAKPAEAAQAGAALADDVTSDMDKQAAEAILIDAVAETVAVGEDAAMRYIDYMRKCATAAYNAQKAAKAKGTKSAAEGDDSSDPKHDSGEGSNEETAEQAPGGDEAGGGDAGGGGAPGDDQLMAALSGGGGDAGAMGGGGDIGAQGAMQGMMGGDGGAGGGMPPADPAAGGGLPGGMPPDAAGGAGGGMMPPGDPGMGAPGSGGDLSPEDLQVLMHVLAQAGVTPEQLEAAAAQKQARLLKAAKAKGQPIPQWRPKNAAEAQRAEEMLAYVRELTGTK